MKRTKKFIAAEKIALKIGVAVDTYIYKNLEKNNYFWSSDLGKWLLEDEPDLLTRSLKIRVWADGERIQQDCEEILEALDP